MENSTSKLPETFTIIGMDPPAGKNCGWAVVRFKDNKPHLIRKFTQVLDKACGDTGLEDIYQQLDRMINEEGVTVLCMERQMGGGLQFTRAKLNEFVGVTKLCCHRHGIKVVEVSPNHLKLVFAGHGSAPKQKIMSNVVKTFGLASPGPEHECDAVALAVSYLIDNGWQGYTIQDPYTDEEKEADKLAKIERKQKKAARAAKKEAEKKASKKAKG